MDLTFTADEVAFRDEARTWLEENVPRDPRPDDGPEMRAFDLAWQRAQYDGGWAGISWPVEFGGRGEPLIRQLIWAEESARARAPWPGCCFVAVHHAGPVLMACGTIEQQRTHLPWIMRGDAVWCQGFSEPGAGSDLGALQTRAVVDGDDLVVTGQKIWTSYAQYADHQELLVRTNPEAPKHKGITMVICDLKTTEGVEIRPIMTMAGIAEFCEVFYEEARIPLANVVGEIDSGWRVTMAALSIERGAAFMLEQLDFLNVVDELIAEARTRTGPDGRRPAIQDDELASRLAVVRAEALALRSLTYLSVSRAVDGRTAGAEGSMTRLFYSELAQRVFALGVDILGPDVALWDATVSAPWSWTRRYARSFANTIGAGTKDVQRNIIGERVLGLPR